MDGKISELEKAIYIPFVYRSSLEKHLNFEFRYLSKHSSFISLQTFQSFSSMPSILSRKLYFTMNKRNNQQLSKEEFINGFTTMYYGSVEERVRFLFEFLSYDAETISVEDLKIILYHMIIGEVNANRDIEQVDSLIAKMRNDIKERGESEGGVSDKKIRFEDFMRYLYKDCGVYYLFFSFFMRDKKFNTEYLSFLLSKKDKLTSETKLNKSKTKIIKESSDKLINSMSCTIIKPGSTKYVSSENLSFKSALFDKPSLISSKNVNLPKSTTSISFSKISPLSLNIIHKISHNEQLKLPLFESKSTAQVSTKQKIDEFEENDSSEERSSESDIDEEELNELSTFESDLLSTKSALNVTADKTPIKTLSMKQMNNLSSFFINNEVTFPSFPFEEDIILFQHGEQTHQQCRLKFFDKYITIYKEAENHLIDIIPLVKLFPCSKSEIKERNFDSKFFSVSLTSALFDSEISNNYAVYHIMFSNKDNANDLIDAIVKAENIKDYRAEYKVKDLIGEGHFGKVFTVQSLSSNKIFAMKLITRDILTQTSNDLEIINNETSISRTVLSKFYHENIMHCYAVFESLTEIALIYDYIDNGTLTSHLNSHYSLENISEVLSQIITGVQFLHKIGLVHRDLKPDNLVVDRNHTVKIVDFGLSMIIAPSERLNENYGTLIFTAPEILLNKEYNAKVDVWSVGVIAFYLLFGILPFTMRGKDSNDEIAMKIVSKEMNFPYKRFDRNEYDIRIRKFITIAVNKESNERPFMNDIEYEKL